MKKAWFFVVLLTVFVLVTLPKLGNATNEKVTVTPEQSLPTVETAENLRNLLKESQSSRALMGLGRLSAGDVMLGAVNKSAQTSEASAHLKDEDILKSGQYYLNSSKAIERIIFIKDTLYTLSQAMIKANDLHSLQEKNSLILK